MAAGDKVEVAGCVGAAVGVLDKEALDDEVPAALPELVERPVACSTRWRPGEADAMWRSKNHKRMGSGFLKEPSARGALSSRREGNDEPGSCTAVTPSNAVTVTALEEHVKMCATPKHPST